MRRSLFLLLFALSYFSALASSQKDMLYQLSRDYSIEMWRQGEDKNPMFVMDHQAYEFYFKHLLDTYRQVYKSSVKSSDSEGLLTLYHKTCSLLEWKVKNKEFSYLKKYVKLKKKIEDCPLMAAYVK